MTEIKSQKWYLAIFLLLTIGVQGIKAQNVFNYDLSQYDYLKSDGEIPAVFLKTPEQLFKEVEDELKKDEYSWKDRRQAERYWQSYFDFLTIKLKTGMVAFGDPLTKYLNQVKNILLENNPELQSKIAVFLLKSPEVNAFMGGDGKLFVNVGLLANAKSEAEIAFILAHEISHYIKEHSFEGFRQKEELDRKSKSLFARKRPSALDAFKEITGRSQQQEMEADRDGLLMYTQVGYPLSGADNALTTLHRSYLPFAEKPLDAAFFDTKAYEFPDTLLLQAVKPITFEENYMDESHSHPNIAKRRAALDLMRSSSENEGDLFHLSKDIFDEVQLLAQFETIRLLMLDFAYAEALFNIHELLYKYPENKFLQISRAECLYGVAVFNITENGDAVLYPYSLMEGEVQNMHYILKHLTKGDLAVLALVHLNRVASEFPEEKEHCNMLGSTLFGFLKIEEKMSAFSDCITFLKKDRIAASILESEEISDYFNSLWNGITSIEKNLPNKRRTTAAQKEALRKNKKKRMKEKFGALEISQVNVLEPSISYRKEIDLNKKELIQYESAFVKDFLIKSKLKSGLTVNPALSNVLTSDNVEVFNVISRLTEIMSYQSFANYQGVIPPTAYSNLSGKLRLGSPYVMEITVVEDYYYSSRYYSQVINIDLGISVYQNETFKAVGKYHSGKIIKEIDTDLKILRP